MVASWAFGFIDSVFLQEKKNFFGNHRKKVSWTPRSVEYFQILAGKVAAYSLYDTFCSKRHAILHFTVFIK